MNGFKGEWTRDVWAFLARFDYGGTHTIGFSNRVRCKADLFKRKVAESSGSEYKDRADDSHTSA
jgi:hypothetical protein